MDIEQDYLASIFSGEQLFVFQSDRVKVEYKIDDASAQEEVKEPEAKVTSAKVEKSLPEKEVMVLVNHHLDANEKDTLAKLLKAMNIADGQYEIIYEHPDQLKSIKDLKLFLAFHNQYVQSQEYAILKINKGNAIYAHDLSELNKDTSKKLMLWNLLKKIV